MARLAPWSQVTLSVVGALGISYIFYDLARNKKIFGGTVPVTLSEEWAEATAKRKDHWPREAGPPVVLDPIHRRNAIIKQRGDKGADRESVKMQ